MSSFSIQPATKEDVPRLSEIHVSACAPDNLFSLYFEDDEEFDRRVRKMLEGQIGDPTWTHLKAVDNESGQVAAWASWHHCFDGVEREGRRALSASPSEEVEPRGGFEFPGGVATFVKEDTEKWIKAWTGGMEYMRCLALFTDSKFRKRGMASSLLQRGNDIADARRLPIFVQASPYGFPVYSKFGYHDVQHLDLELQKWAPGAHTNDKGYGLYRLRYMLRLPQRPKEE